MKNQIICFLLLFIGSLTYAQNDNSTLKLSLETDILAYTSSGGYSIWGTMQYNKNRVSLGFINYPIRYPRIYEETGVKDIDRFIRLALWRYANDKNAFFYGISLERHQRILEEEITGETLEDFYFKIGAMIGYEFHPFSKQDNFLQNLSLSLWGGPGVILQNNKLSRVFEETGTVYDVPGLFQQVVGVNISYTFINKSL